MTSAWPAIEHDLRRALRNAGRCEATIDRMLAELSRAFAALERVRGKVDDELLWALVALQADRYRRRARQAS